MGTITKDAKGFVDGVVSFLGSEGKTRDVARVKTLFTKVTAQARKEKIANVTTNIPLAAVEKQRLERLIAKTVGHAIEMNYTVNPLLLGGLTIQVADWIIDTSLDGQLDEMVDTLQKV